MAFRALAALTSALNKRQMSSSNPISLLNPLQGKLDMSQQVTQCAHSFQVLQRLKHDRATHLDDQLQFCSWSPKNILCGVEFAPSLGFEKNSNHPNTNLALKKSTFQETNISHLGKRKSSSEVSISKVPLKGRIC